MEDKYKEFISGVEIEDICLSSAQFKKFGEPDPSKYPEVRVSFSPKKSSFKQNGEVLVINQDFVFVLDEIEEDEENSHKIFELKGRYQLSFTSKVKIDQNIFDLFKRRNIPINLHPYVRELVQSTMVRVGLPAFTLPALKLKGK